MLRKKKKFYIGLCILICVVCMVLIVGFIYFSKWSMQSQPISKDSAAKIVSGMTKSEVKMILGPPRQIYREGEDGEQWTYGSSLQWNFYSVYFSKEGKVINSEFDD